MNQRFLDDLRFWVATDRRMALRLVDMVVSITRDPFGGIGKPEPLKRFGADVWSRRLSSSDRLVYIVRDDEVELLQARFHCDR
jgi:toxin YoeB